MNTANPEPLQWIESASGPLILLEKSLLRHWHGYIEDGTSKTDYDRACEIGDFLATLKVGTGYGLVLGEEPFSTTWWNCQQLGQGLLVRWVYAESEARVLDLLESLPSDYSPTKEVEFEVLDGTLILFDAACPGKTIDNSLMIKMCQGRYLIQTVHHNPDDETSLILHRFVPKAGLSVIGF